jgi:hypothetical protein
MNAALPRERGHHSRRKNGGSGLGKSTTA